MASKKQVRAAVEGLYKGRRDNGELARDVTEYLAAILAKGYKPNRGRA